jgi:hypothetical protein
MAAHLYSPQVSSSAERERAISVRVGSDGVVRLSWARGLRITGTMAREAMSMVDELNGDAQRPLLVDMTGTATLTRDARVVFTERCSASIVALVGRSAVDRVIANFALGVSAPPVPTRFFTSDPAAVAWLCHGDTRT